MNATMTERFGVAGALLVKLFGRPDDEAARFSERADRVRDIGIQQAMFSRTFFVSMLLVASLAQALTYGLGGWLAVTGRGGITAGTVVTLALLLTRLYGPLTAAVQRPRRRDERDGVVRTGLRGPRSRARDRREAGRRSTYRPAPDTSSSATSRSATRPRRRCRSPRWKTWPPLTVR